jgi:hypothetical protein
MCNRQTGTATIANAAQSCINFEWLNYNFELLKLAAQSCPIANDY